MNQLKNLGVHVFYNKKHHSIRTHPAGVHLFIYMDICVSLHSIVHQYCFVHLKYIIKQN